MGYRGDIRIDLLNSGLGEGSSFYSSYHRHMSDKLVLWKPRGENLPAQLIADIQLLKTFSRLLAEGNRWDVIHVHEWPALQVAWAARDALKVPLVATMHLCISILGEVDGSPQADWEATDKTLLAKLQRDLPKSEAQLLANKFVSAGAPGRELSAYLMNQEARLIVESDETILCSRAYVEMAQKHFLGNGLIKKRINMIHNGIDPEEWNPRAGDGERAKEEHYLPMDRPIALYAGRIAHMKGVEPLLTAIEQKDSGYCAVIVGAVNAVTEEDAESWDVTKRIRALQKAHPERLRWLNYQHGQKLKDLYAAADVGLMPSIHEPFGIVALEFMAMGVPLIATEVDGLGEIVQSGKGDANEYAMIIPPKEPGHIVQALELLKDPKRKEFLTAQGLKRIKSFSWEEAADKTVGVYRQAIASANTLLVRRSRERERK